MLTRLLALILATAAMAPGRCAADENSGADIGYRLGNGLQIPGTGWTLGGYATGSYDNLSDASARVNLDNLSLFAWWEGDSRFKFFSELELEDFAQTMRASGGHDDYLSLERLYLDYALTDTATVRAGKFLTPVGRWNLIHATPLVWTTSRPLVTTLPFPTNMTGLMLTGNAPVFGSGIEYAFYSAGNSDLRTNPDLDAFSTAVGGHVSIPTGPRGQIGFSYSDFEQKHMRFERKHLYGVDYFWTRNRWELSMEAIYRTSDLGGRWDEKGGYVQLAAPLADRLYAVGRYELFRSANQPNATELRVLGLNYRLRPALVLKVEWVGSTHNTVRAPDGLLSSISVLF